MKLINIKSKEKLKILLSKLIYLLFNTGAFLFAIGYIYLFSLSFMQGPHDDILRNIGIFVFYKVPLIHALVLMAWLNHTRNKKYTFFQACFNYQVFSSIFFIMHLFIGGVILFWEPMNHLVMYFSTGRGYTEEFFGTSSSFMFFFSWGTGVYLLYLQTKDIKIKNINKEQYLQAQNFLFSELLIAASCFVITFFLIITGNSIVFFIIIILLCCKFISLVNNLLKLINTVPALGKTETGL